MFKTTTFFLLAFVSTTFATASPIILTAELSGDLVVPSVISSSSGTATFTLHDGPTPTLDYFIQLDGLDLDSSQTVDVNDNITGVHVHVAPPGANGPLIFGILSPQDDADDLVVDPVAGTISGTWDSADNALAPGLLTDHISNLLNGHVYLQVHTVQFPSPSAELRGQLTTVPEPTSIAAWILAGAAALGFFRRSGQRPKFKAAN